jgi:Domain of unknown function (DUF2017).
MEICRRENAIEIVDLDPFLAELLRQIPASADPTGGDAANVDPEGVRRAQERLFSAPASPSEKEICQEWKVYVEPELHRLFLSATETVAEDLKQLNEKQKPFANHTLRIPLEHGDAWLNALNQARLALHARYGFTDSELCDHERSPVASRRDLSLFQVNFYGFIQEFILRGLSEEK